MKKILLFLFLASFLLSGCTGSLIVRPRPNIDTCKYCTTGWRWVCTHRDIWGNCYDGYYDCLGWQWLSCGTTYPPHYHKPPAHPYHPGPHHPPHNPHPGPHNPHPGPHNPHPGPHHPGHGPHHSATLEEELILDNIFGSERKSLSGKELADKIGGFTKKDAMDFENNGNKFTGDQLLRIADALNTSVAVVENVYENGVIVESEK